MKSLIEDLKKSLGQPVHEEDDHPKEPPDTDKPVEKLAKEFGATPKSGGVWGVRFSYVVKDSSAARARTAFMKAAKAAGLKNLSPGKFMGSSEVGLAAYYGNGRIFARFRQKTSRGEVTTYVSVESMHNYEVTK